jgi:hypothetical protein
MALGEGSHGSILNGNYAATRVTSGWKSTAMSPVGARQLDEVFRQPFLVRCAAGNLALCRSALPECAAGAALGYAERLPHMVDAHATARRARDSFPVRPPSGSSGTRLEPVAAACLGPGSCPHTACASGNTSAPSRRSGAPHPRSPSPVREALPPVKASAPSLRACLAFLPSLVLLNGITPSQWVDHFSGGTPHHRSSVPTWALRRRSPRRGLLLRLS